MRTWRATAARIALVLFLLCAVVCTQAATIVCTFALVLIAMALLRPVFRKRTA